MELTETDRPRWPNVAASRFTIAVYSKRRLLEAPLGADRRLVRYSADFWWAYWTVPLSVTSPFLVFTVTLHGERRPRLANSI